MLIQNISTLDDHKGAFEDIWSSIHSNVGSPGTTEPSSFLHPLVKKSTCSLLSQKSLEVCTESLGSETGSESTLDHLLIDVPLIRCSRRSLTSQSVLPTTFPPPLPSLSQRNLQMRAHRHDGRLVVEAVSVPSPNRLRAFRQDGRLLLTFAQNDDNNGDTTILQDVEEEKEENEITIVTTEGKTTSYYSTIIMCKVTNSWWPRNLNATIMKMLQLDGDNLELEYYWKNLVSLGGPQQNNKVGPKDANGELLMAQHNNNNYYVEEKVEKEEEENQIRGCKRRSSLLFWDSDNLPFGIAT